MKLTTTLAKLQKAGACESGYKKLAKHLGGIKKYGKKTPIDLLTILGSNDVDDCLWALRATEQNCDRIARLMAADFAYKVLPLYEQKGTSKAPRLAIEAAVKFANGEISRKELAAAGAAAWDATGAAAWAAARDAARAAARAATGDAARAAAWDAARDAARAAAWAATGAAARKEQEEIIKIYLAEE